MCCFSKLQAPHTVFKGAMNTKTDLLSKEPLNDICFTFTKIPEQSSSAELPGKALRGVLFKFIFVARQKNLFKNEITL